MPDTLFFACLFCVTIELCVAVSCSVLQCVAALHLYFHISHMYSVFACPMLSLMYVFPLWLYSCALQCIAVCYSVLQHVAAYCSVLQRVAACCSVLQLFIFIFISHTCILRVYASYFPFCVSLLCDNRTDYWDCWPAGLVGGDACSVKCRLAHCYWPLPCTLQCVGAFCSLLQRVAVFVEYRSAYCYWKLPRESCRVAGCCRVLQCVAGCCSVLQGVAG